MDLLTLPVIKEIVKLLGLDEHARRGLKNWRASLNNPKYFSELPELHYGRLGIADWVVLEGVFPEGMVIDATLNEDVSLPLPAEIEAHKQAFIRTNAERTERDIKPHFYNGPLLVMYSLYITKTEDKHERPIFRIKVLRSGYMDYACTIASLDASLFGTDVTVRERYFTDWNGEVKTELPVVGCPGLTLAVVTKDEQLIMVKRGANVSVAAGAWHCSVDEGIRPEDVVHGKVDYRRAAYRGLLTELGIAEKSVSEPPMITSMGYSRGLCQHGAIGHVFLDIYLKDVMKGLPLAKQGRENEAWKAIPFQPKALSKELRRMITNKEPAMPSFGLVTCLSALHASNRYSIEEVNACFDDEVFADGSLVYPSAKNLPDVRAFR